jgi:hypothetical protein
VASAQPPAPNQGHSQQPSKKRNDGATAQFSADRRSADAPDRRQEPGGARNRPQNEPSAAYRESIRRAAENRRQRRARRRQQPGQGIAGAVGAIVPWPMPPALVIRQTPDVHDEIGAFLSALRR